MEMVLSIFIFYSYLFSFLFPTSLYYNYLSIGFNHFGIFLSSKDIISFLFNGSIYKKAHILSSSELFFQYYTLSGKWGWYNAINVQYVLLRSNCLVELTTKTTSLSTIEFISLLIWVMLKYRRLEINFQIVYVYIFRNLLDGVCIFLTRLTIILESLNTKIW
jgi:hypothetical protein